MRGRNKNRAIEKPREENWWLVGGGQDASCCLSRPREAVARVVAGRLARTSGFKLPFAIIFLVLAQRNQTDRAMVVVRSGGTAGEEGRTSKLEKRQQWANELSARCAGEPSLEKSGCVPLETRMILKETSKGQIG
jgi:hypothetical protein